MRFWHKDLIHFLPQKQLVSQWRECSAILSNIIKSGFPRSPLVIKMMNFPLFDTIKYINLVYNELVNRQYKPNKLFLNKINLIPYHLFKNDNVNKEIYKGWHNQRYLRQCFFNLQEKFDCGVIKEKEWNLIYHNFVDKI